MPKFEVVLVKTETIESTLSLTMTAKDADAAEEQALALLADEDKLTALIKRQGATWEGSENSEEVEIDSVNVF